MQLFTRDGDALEVRHQHEVLRVEAWGADSVRMRAARDVIPPADAGALTLPPPTVQSVALKIDGNAARLVNGELTVEVSLAEDDGYPFPLVRFLRTANDEELLAEEREHFWWPGARVLYGNRAGSGEIHQQFKAYDGERLYGLGQRTHGRRTSRGLPHLAAGRTRACDEGRLRRGAPVRGR